MPRLVSITLAISMLAACVAVTACAQSADPPLGDLARNLRRNQTPPPGVIDNDNLSQVMEAGASRNWGMVGLRFSLGQDVVQMVNASNPDVTCALSFNAKNRDPETTPKPQTLPDSELVKLDGPATIVDDALQLSVYNGTAWDLREITVGLTIVRPSSPAAATRLKRQLAEQAVGQAAAGNWAEAAETNQKLLELGADADAENRLAKALWEQGELGAAREHYQSALALDPTNRIAERNIDRLRTLLVAAGEKTVSAKSLRLGKGDTSPVRTSATG